MFRQMLHISRGPTVIRAFPFQHPVLYNDVLCKLNNDVEQINTIPLLESSCITTDNACKLVIMTLIL